MRLHNYSPGLKNTVEKKMCPNFNKLDICCIHFFISSLKYFLYAENGRVWCQVWDVWQLDK